MDTWMVAVAAGAGYIAQHFKKFKQNGEQITSSESSSSSSFNTSLNNKPNSPKQPPERKWPFLRSAKRDNLRKDDSEGVSSTKVASTSEIGSDRVSEGKGRPRSRMILRNRTAIRPLSSLESCVMAQLHSKHVEIKEYKSSPFASPSSRTIRPFVVTDGNNVINRSSGVSVMGNDAMLNVCLGISFGILYSFMANRREVEKLNRLLKQTESLVQDLEEELEMKDSLIMQELTINDHKSQRTDADSINDGSYNLEQLTDENDKDSGIKKAKDESFSKIEAELEAELEMLELNMTSSTLERRISDLFEADPEFEPGVAHGELRADMVLNKTNEDDDDDATPCANYAVSPRELSLRLHEVLQWQLEERIRELEAEIQTKNTTNNRNHNKYWRDLSSSGDEVENPNHVDEPVVLNLSGEALDAYNEACNEFANFDDEDDSDEEDGTPENRRSEDGNNGKDYDEEEMEKMLIKHIVEKARQGSPVVINAQRALFSE